jgi:hypothetical protein
MMEDHTSTSEHIYLPESSRGPPQSGLSVPHSLATKFVQSSGAMVRPSHNPPKGHFHLHLVLSLELSLKPPPAP